MRKQSAAVDEVWRILIAKSFQFFIKPYNRLEKLFISHHLFFQDVSHFLWLSKHASSIVLDWEVSLKSLFQASGEKDIECMELFMKKYPENCCIFPHSVAPTKLLEKIEEECEKSGLRYNGTWCCSHDALH